MTFLIIVALELVVGSIVGFVLSDNKEGLSLEEVKISSILFLIATAVVFWHNPQLNGIVFTELALSWFILTGGVILGELIKMKIIFNIVQTIKKKDIQLAINELVQVAARTQHMNRASDKDTLQKKLYEVQTMLNALARRSEQEQSKAFLKKLRYLFQLCEDYTNLSINLRADAKEGNMNESLLESWNAIGEELTSLSWDTLNHAEEHMKCELGKAFSMKLVKRALHR